LKTGWPALRLACRREATGDPPARESLPQVNEEKRMGGRKNGMGTGRIFLMIALQRELLGREEMKGGIWANNSKNRSWIY
jgi:Na+-transporting NADH:ubiquinone oxidoreductase subunit NqrD